MWAIGVKTAATCDTIDGPSVKDLTPLQEGSVSLPSWPLARLGRIPTIRGSRPDRSG
jgi:hypothetical protein